jgi:hypothetical protein
MDDRVRYGITSQSVSIVFMHSETSFQSTTIEIPYKKFWNLKQYPTNNE